MHRNGGRLGHEIPCNAISARRAGTVCGTRLQREGNADGVHRNVAGQGQDQRSNSGARGVDEGRERETRKARGGDADYATALRLGHSVEPIIMEVSGGLTPAACKLLRTLAHVHGAGLGADTNAPWCARSFKSIYTQRLSVALQRAAAEELLDTIRCDASWNDSA